MTRRSAYAADTDVPPEQSRAEIEATLKRYGATRYGYMEEPRRAVIACELQGRRLRFVVIEPSPGDPEFQKTETGRRRDTAAARSAWEKAVRQRWRALALVIKAKLEAVASGIVTFDDEFLAHVVLPSGRTVADEVRPRVAAAYESGRNLTLLPSMGGDPQ